ncbi:MAG TPA: FliH/SctL family protein [Mycobacteriales bacterium]|jgi:flagellar assembly protein FliH|nr:Flagellar assembly protein FliH/Type secretion system HrpE [Cryptosporangiaceae bacterium]MDQ1676812.1 flagellar assembly protein FliH [Actinomycetota bacterium]HEV7755514.1 FliH/SctL family protein [Mycobacteriales bacterium]
MSSSHEFRPLGLVSTEEPTVRAAGFTTDLRRSTPKAPVAVPVDGGWRSATSGDLIDQVREAARSEGYAAGWGEGRRVAGAEARARAAAVSAEAGAAEGARQKRHASAVAALADAATALETRAVPVLDEFSDAILAAALVLAEAVLGRELALGGDGGAIALRRALDLAPKLRPVTVRLHPEDLVTLSLTGSTVEIDGRTVTLVPDASVGRGGAIAECDATQVDARLGAALDRVGTALLP